MSLFRHRAVAIIGVGWMCCGCVGQEIRTLPHKFEREEVKVGVSNPYHARGLVDFESEGEPTGFGPEVVREAAERMGLKVVLVRCEGEELIPRLERGEFDAAVAVSVTQDRMKRVLFTSPLMVSRGAVYGREGTRAATAAADFRGRKVGVARNGVGHQWCLEQGVDYVLGPTLKDALDRLQAGECDYVVTSMSAGRVEIERFGVKGLKEWPLEDSSVSRSFSIAVNRSGTALLTDLNDGLAMLRETGRFDELYDATAGRYQPRAAPKAVSARVFWSVIIGAAGVIAAMGTAYGLTQRALRRSVESMVNVRRESRLLHDEVPALMYTYVRRSDGTREILTIGERVDWWQEQFPGFDPRQPWEVTLKPRMHPDDIDSYRQAVHRSRESASLFAVDYRLKNKDGHYRWLHSRVVPTPTEDGVLWCALLIDIHDSHQMRTTLARTETLYSELFQASPESIILFRAEDERVVEANARALALYGLPRDAFIGSSMLDFTTDREAGRRAIRRTVTEGRYDGRFKHKLPDGREIVVHAFAGAIQLSGEWFILTINRDITNQLRDEAQHARIEAELRSAKQMEALGVMAGGIAHDFNNLLVGILGNASLARRQIGSPEALAQTITRIEESGQFAADLVKRLTEYAGKSGVPAEPIELARLSAGVVDTLGARVTRHARVRVMGTAAWIHGDPVGIKQAVMNLVTNAADAQGEAPGELRIRTGMRQFDPHKEADCAVGNDLAAGTYAFVCVEDSGPGIDPVIRERMFEPFVSTKSQGRGLGLALVLSTIRRSGGAVCVRSVAGVGTWFELLWPARPAPTEAGAAPRPVRVPIDGGKLALVVDDSESVRSTAVEIVRSLGFTVVEASSGEAGLTIARSRQPDLVVLDVSLPGMSGWRVLEELRKVSPKSRVIISTGHDPTRGHEGGTLPDAVLPKPYTVDQLVETVNQALQPAPFG